MPPPANLWALPVKKKSRPFETRPVKGRVFLQLRPHLRRTRGKLAALVPSGNI